MNDQDISALVSKLGRPAPSGRIVIERAAIQAAGGDSPAIIDWIMNHSGVPETAVSASRSRGLHGSRINEGTDPGARQALRFTLPADALS
jgi:hypothetical protein